MSLKLTQAKESGQKQHRVCNISAATGTSSAEAHSIDLALLEKLDNSLVLETVNVISVLGTGTHHCGPNTKNNV